MNPTGDHTARVERALDMLRAHILERSVPSHWDDEHAYEVARAILTCLRGTASVPAGNRRPPLPMLSRESLKCAVRFIHENLDTRLRWDELASAVGLAPFVFGRRFMNTTGLTPHQYVTRCRLRRAMSLLANTDRSICDIALDVGCSCQSHLNTLFRKHAGTTPRLFRAASRVRGAVRPSGNPFSPSSAS